MVFDDENLNKTGLSCSFAGLYQPAFSTLTVAARGGYLRKNRQGIQGVRGGQ